MGEREYDYAVMRGTETEADMLDWGSLEAAEEDLAYCTEDWTVEVALGYQEAGENPYRVVKRLRVGEVEEL